MFADLPSSAAASFFMLTSQSDGTTTQTGCPSTSAIRVFSTRFGSTPSASAACRPMPLGGDGGIVDIGVQLEGDAELPERKVAGV